MSDTSTQDDERTRRVAVPSESPGGLGARRSGHFGHARCFTVVEVTGCDIGEASVVTNASHQEGACMLPVMLLLDNAVDAIIVDAMGGRPLSGVLQAGIAVHAGVGETVEQAVTAYPLDLLPPVGPGGTCRH